MMIGKRDHAGAKLDPFGAFAGGRQKHFRRSDHLPARGMMLAAPEFVIAERVKLFDQIEVAAELQHRVLADRMMRGEEGTEFEASRFEKRHGHVSPKAFFLVASAAYLTFLHRKRRIPRRNVKSKNDAGITILLVRRI